MDVFGQQLKRWLKKHPEEDAKTVAKRIGVSHETVWRWMRWETKAPSISKVKFVNRILGTSFTRGVK